MGAAEFAAAVRRSLAETRRSKHRAALDGGLPPDAIRSVLEGHVPRLDRAEEICEALGLELYVGPPREVGDRDTADAVPRPGEQPTPSQRRFWRKLVRELEGVRDLTETEAIQSLPPAMMAQAQLIH